MRMISGWGKQFVNCALRQPARHTVAGCLFKSVLFAAVFAIGLMWQVCCVAEAQASFDFYSVVNKARDLAKEPFREPANKVPEFLLKIGYDAWRDIRFEPEQALWQNDKLHFTVQFFHLGMMYDRPITINIVKSGVISRVPFSSDLFTYGKNDFREKVPDELGFAGFRLHYPINTKDYHDEVIVFLGASYLRALAENQQYGMSARGIAIDTALSHGEEFPYFKEFWIVKPSPSAGEITIYALLDSNSLTGAYRYIVKPGKETLINVKSTLFLRKEVDKLGIAPLTSMFFYGENTNQRPTDDFRSEVHDSDGLLVISRPGERLWRPLRNPRTLQIDTFDAPDPVGFGLLQRDQDFDSYQDLEARYDLRPSVLITPTAKWGEGHVELIQIPTDNEMNDNIIAFWVPSRLPNPGQPISYSYSMRWHFPDKMRLQPLGHVAATRTARGKQERFKKFIIDFEGEPLQSFPPDKALTGVVMVDDRTRLVEQQLYKNRVSKGWRLVFEILVKQDDSIDRLLVPKKLPLELKAFLKERDRAVTETWSYAFQP